MVELFSQFGFTAVIDIAIMTFIIYNLLVLIRGTRAAQMVLGMFILVGALFVVSQFYPLTTFKWVMDKFYSSLIIIIFILFQEDIRTVLSRMGKKPFLSGSETVSSKVILDEITRAAASLASKKIGALIAIERNILLHRYAESGIVIDAKISQELLMAIFHTSSPIHDGAVLIIQGRLAAAGCFLPLTRDENVDPDMGTRHRAAIGLSQETDAIIVVVSEEKGAISLCVDGEMTRGLSAKELRKSMRMQLNQIPRDEDGKPNTRIRAKSLWKKLKKSTKQGELKRD